MGLASKLAAAQASQGGAPGGAPQGAYGAPPAPPQSRPDPYGAPPSYGGAPPPQSSPYGAPSGPPPGQQQQYGAPPGAPPGQQPGQQQSQYGAPSGAPPGQSPYGAPPQQQQQPPYGQPPQQQQQYGQPPQQQQQYGQPAQGQQQQYPPPGQQPPPHQGGGGSMDPRQVEQILAQCVQEQKISSFYPPGSLSQIAQRVAASGAIEKVMAVWNIPRELAADLLKLSLFDIILLVDDSGSMAFEENGERIDDLKLILGRIAFVGALFDQDGIQVRFMNSNVQGNNINSEASAMNLLSQIKYSGLTPLGTSLDQKIIQPLVLGPAQQGRLQKPVLVITITDGTPAGEPRDQVFRVIQNAVSTLQRTRYGPDALSFQFAQVGNDMKAQAFLGEIDTHPQIGSLVDCTSNYEVESAEMQRKAGIELTPDMWIVKLALGGIDDSYDEKDERN